MAHIDYFFATNSPFTYLAGSGLEDIAARHGATITYKPLDIMGLFARTGGTPPRERHVSRQQYRLQDLERRAKRAGVPIHPKPTIFPVNSAPSAYAVIAAQNAGGGNVGRLVQLFLRAYWGDDRNIADDAVIRDCLTEAGFDAGLADSGLLQGAETFASNLEEAVRRGVFGSPFYITDDDQRFWGHDRFEDLDMVLSGKL